MCIAYLTGSSDHLPRARQRKLTQSEHNEAAKL